MRIDVTMCYNCICNACTKRKCPYAHTRCQSCDSLSFQKTFDCDWFENRRTAPKYIRVKRKSKPAPDMLNRKLDYIIEQLGLAEPTQDVSGTFAVLFDDYEIFQGSYVDAIAFLTKVQRGFSKPLSMRRVALSFD